VVVGKAAVIVTAEALRVARRGLVDVVWRWPVDRTDAPVDLTDQAVRPLLAFAFALDIRTDRAGAAARAGVTSRPGGAT
jgi:hypothetical protein